MNNFYLLVTFISCLVTKAQAQDPEVQIETRVVDEAGQAISGASVTGWFAKLKTTNPFDGQENLLSKGVTDETGIFTASNPTLGFCGVGAEHAGYYISRKEIRLDKSKGGKWIPWHQVIELKLRKKASPTAMFAKRLDRFELPVTDKSIAYDLKAGDWVSPHGKGVLSDIVFSFQREFNSRFDYNWQLSVQFPGEGNGWQAIPPAEESPQSELRLPRTAPADGYAHKDMFLAIKRNAGDRWETNSTSATNFFFRVRSEFDESKRLKTAFYGKLLGPIKVNVQGTKTAKLYFTYYLNPTSLDRNMEFDPKKNLFKGLRSDEEVREP